MFAETDLAVWPADIVPRLLAIRPVSQVQKAADAPSCDTATSYREWQAARRVLRQQERNASPPARPWRRVGGKLDRDQFLILLVIRSVGKGAIDARELAAVTGLQSVRVAAAVDALVLADFVSPIEYATGTRFAPSTPDD